MKTAVHLSYSSKHRTIAKILQSHLDILGCSVSTDIENQEPGKNWQREMKKVLANAEIILFKISSSLFEKKDYLQKKISKILEILSTIPKGKIFLIPIRIDNADMPVLSLYPGKVLRRFIYFNYTISHLSSRSVSSCRKPFQLMLSSMLLNSVLHMWFERVGMYLVFIFINTDHCCIVDRL